MSFNEWIREKERQTQKQKEYEKKIEQLIELDSRNKVTAEERSRAFKE